MSESRGNGGHLHERHEHVITGDADRRYLTTALLLLGAFMVGEVVVSLMTGSLALLSDAGHMLSDVGAIGIALWTMALIRRPAHGGWTWGWQRAEILSGAGNGITMLVVAGIVGIEAVERLIHPPEVSGGPVLVVALVGVVVNIAVAWLVARANRSSLNVEGAYQHILTDIYGFIGTVIAGLVIVLTGWTRADAIASLVVCGLMLHASWGLLRDAGLVLLEVAPAGTDLNKITRHLTDMPHVRAVHDLHVWSIGSSQPSLSAHVVVGEECFRDGHAPQVLDEVQACLASHFNVEHSSLQLEVPTHISHELGACR